MTMQRNDDIPNFNFPPPPDDSYMDGETDPYAGYQKWKERTQQMPMETPTSFLGAAVIGEKDYRLKFIIDGFLQLGLAQLNAGCGNRSIRIKSHEMEINRIEFIMDGNDPDEWQYADPQLRDVVRLFPDRSYEFKNLPKLSKKTRDLYIARRKELKTNINILKERIELARERNTYRDYGYLKLLYTFRDVERELNGAKFVHSPFFLQECMKEVDMTRQGKFYEQSQSINSNLIYYDEPHRFQEQRGLQMPGFNRGGRASDKRANEYGNN